MPLSQEPTYSQATKKNKAKKRAHNEHSKSSEKSAVITTLPQPEILPVPPKKKKSKTDKATATKTKITSKAIQEKKQEKKSAKRSTMNELFGYNSEENEGNDIPKNILYSYLTQRTGNGYARQTYNTKIGSHYVELKIYDCAEIDNVSPMNRWRHAIFALKCKSNTDTKAWSSLTQYITDVKKEFEKKPKNDLPTCI